METLVILLWGWCVTVLDHLVPGLVILFCLPRLSRHLVNSHYSYYGPGAVLLLSLLWMFWRQRQISPPTGTDPVNQMFPHHPENGELKTVPAQHKKG